MTISGFDAYAEAYDADLARGLALSGEDKRYFARGRVAWLAARLRELGAAPRSVLDFGCGIGTAAPLLVEMLDAGAVVGVDQSEESLALARRTIASERVEFVSLAVFRPAASFDLVFTNGVFHHVPVEERSGALALVHRALRPGGLFALWENNAWNPGTRWVMRRIPFDRDAVPLSPPGARRLVRGGGFEVLRTDFLFVFPRILRVLRRFEPALASLPLGAQYLVLCRKP